MDINAILEVVKYILPAVLVLAGVSIILQQVGKRNDRMEMFQIRQETLAKVIPLRLNAYERATVFLERIRPESLLIRVNGSGKTAKVFQQQLILEVRAEFEHNLSQQIYISNPAWSDLVTAKEYVMTLVHNAGKELPENAAGIDLGKQILVKYSENQEDFITNTIAKLKADLTRL